MREFDEVEKQILRKIKRYKESGITINFSAILDDFYKDRALKIRRDTKESWILFSNSKFGKFDSNIGAWIPKDEMIKGVAPSTEILIKIIFLLNYLEKNGFIFLYDFAGSDEKVSIFPTLDSSPRPHPFPISDKKLTELLIEYFYKEVYISQSIVTLVNNDFKTKDEIQHDEAIKLANDSLIVGRDSIKIGKQSIKVGKDSIKTANKAITVSIVVGALSVLLSGYSIYLTYANSGQPLDLNPEQVKSVENKITEVSDKLNRLDSISQNTRTTVIKLDSLITTSKPNIPLKAKATKNSKTAIQRKPNS
ncbi:hypothetical protein [Pontibacter flavimaris]|uniref:Uncharacterized protein n=1 Tax=Pontibacter flavimaris TaxID=1797110 RepID=A0A1Q5PCK2_9BACT|nr:hypothetical protein [Pontibacter flavimaris]OKL39979.1 hypothetical protein A3841_16590 [Pontibacter flavimaris]